MHRYVFALHVSMIVCTHKLVREVFSNVCMSEEKMVLGSNGGVISAESHHGRIESTTSKWL